MLVVTFLLHCIVIYCHANVFCLSSLWVLFSSSNYSLPGIVFQYRLIVVNLLVMECLVVLLLIFVILLCEKPIFV